VEFAGGRRGIEGRLVPKAGYRLHRYPAAGLRGSGVFGAFRFFSRFAVALLAAALLIVRLRPHVVLGTGGYASAAPAMAAAILGRPLWLQEQNSVPGSTNRFLSRFAERVYCAFAEAKGSLRRAARVEELPNPVRASLYDLREARPAATAYAAFGLLPERRTLLVFGGSRGAATLSRAIADGWPALAAKGGWQLLAQVAQEELQATRAAVENSGAPTHVCSFIDDMAAAYSVADLVVCRAGALTLAELATVGRPSILVPFPHATDDHQTSNAIAFERAGAAVVIADGELDGPILTAAVERLAERPEELRAMATAATRLAGDSRPAETIARALLERSGMMP
jgi:UDP-N-acetylglucosamine--N-acetylmuramyl-(pentapeptide) pyrophosphoryl-undecaprenol N-acetylglucosamine transferase